MTIVLIIKIETHFVPVRVPDQPLKVKSFNFNTSVFSSQIITEFNASFSFIFGFKSFIDGVRSESPFLIDVMTSVYLMVPTQNI